MSKYQFTLPSSSGSDFNSAEHLPLVVYFYPKDSTPGCTTEAWISTPDWNNSKHWLYRCRHFARRYQIASEFLRQTRLPVELLSDKEETVCKLFDVIKLKKLYGKESLGIERSTFVLDENGEIAHEWRKVKVAGHAQEVLDTISQAS